MYTQAMDTMGKDRDDAPKAVRSADDVERERRFDARIDAGDFIEAKDWMPEHYRKTLVRQISQHAQADRDEIATALRHRIKTLIGISTKVDVGAPESIERTLVGKAKRVVDQRTR